jgi:hypothetical protein
MSIFLIDSPLNDVPGGVFFARDSVQTPIFIYILLPILVLHHVVGYTMMANGSKGSLSQKKMSMSSMYLLTERGLSL